jgi:hypothetical protein
MQGDGRRLNSRWTRRPTEVAAAPRRGERRTTHSPIAALNSSVAGNFRLKLTSLCLRFLAAQTALPARVGYVYCETEKSFIPRIPGNSRSNPHRARILDLENVYFGVSFGFGLWKLLPATLYWGISGRQRTARFVGPRNVLKKKKPR